MVIFDLYNGPTPNPSDRLDWKGGTSWKLSQTKDAKNQSKNKILYFLLLFLISPSCIFHLSIPIHLVCQLSPLGSHIGGLYSGWFVPGKQQLCGLPTLRDFLWNFLIPWAQKCCLQSTNFKLTICVNMLQLAEISWPFRKLFIDRPIDLNVSESIHFCHSSLWFTHLWDVAFTQQLHP